MVLKHESNISFLLHLFIYQNISTHLQLHFLLNRDTKKFSSFLKGIDIPADCGGDAAEDISSGLKVVTENLTWGHGTKARSLCTHVVRLRYSTHVVSKSLISLQNLIYQSFYSDEKHWGEGSCPKILQDIFININPHFSIIFSPYRY